MKFLDHALGILCAVCLMIVFLITSVEAVAYWTPGYYQQEYEKYQVLDDLPEMTMEDLLDVTEQMMDYLRGDRDHLHVFTTMGGEEREFSMNGKSLIWKMYADCFWAAWLSGPSVWLPLPPVF